MNTQGVPVPSPTQQIERDTTRCAAGRSTRHQYADNNSVNGTGRLVAAWLWSAHSRHAPTRRRPHLAHAKGRMPLLTSLTRNATLFTTLLIGITIYL